MTQTQKIKLLEKEIEGLKVRIAILEARPVVVINPQSAPAYPTPCPQPTWPYSPNYPIITCGPSPNIGGHLS